MTKQNFFQDSVFPLDVFISLNLLQEQLFCDKNVNKSFHHKVGPYSLSHLNSNLPCFL